MLGKNIIAEKSICEICASRLGVGVGEDRGIESMRAGSWEWGEGMVRGW